MEKTSTAHQQELAFQAHHGNDVDTAEILPVFMIALLRAQALVVGDAGAKVMATALLGQLGSQDVTDWEQ
ncbi:hypothetical protein AB9K41_09715, partial [Cribrihabitans sp. XS_ASV171]